MVNQEQELVSVIVPIYNAELYLRECLDSILNQSYTNIEVILIDDGSTDKSCEICDAYARGDVRIKVIHQQNSGAAKARRIGVLEAKGKYTCFVDSDDMIAPNMIEYFVSHIGNADLISSGVCCERKNKEVYYRYDSFAPATYDLKEEMDYIICNMITFEEQMKDGFLPYLMNKMFRSNILKVVIKSIDENIVYAEDRDLLFRYVLESSSIVVSDEVFYFYRYNDSSIMHKSNKNIMHDLNALYLSLEEAFQNHPLRNNLMQQLQLFIISRIYRITKFMGFPIQRQSIQYIFPFTNLLENKRFVLYGAGRVGIDYYSQIRNRHEGELILWVDKQYERFAETNLGVKSVKELENVDLDCMLIAVKEKELADSIKQELLEYGVPEEKIWWKEPINIIS